MPNGPGAGPFSPVSPPRRWCCPGWGVCAVVLLGARRLFVVMPILLGSLLLAALAAGFSRLRGDGEPPIPTLGFEGHQP